MPEYVQQSDAPTTYYLDKKIDNDEMALRV